MYTKSTLGQEKSVAVQRKKASQLLIAIRGFVPVPHSKSSKAKMSKQDDYSYDGVDMSDPVNQWQKAIETRDAVEVARLLKLHPDYANMKIMDRYRDGRLNTKGHHQESLDHVARTGHVEIAKLLVEAGANEERIRGSFMLAKPNVAEYLLEHCDDPQPDLGLMTYIANWESLEFWLSRGYKLPSDLMLHNACCGRPSLRHFAPRDDRKGKWKERFRETVRVLLEAGADPNARSFAGNQKWDGAKPWRNNRETPLHHAASSHDIVLVQQLIDAGADKTLTNDLDETPYDWAVKFSAPNEVQKLLRLQDTITDFASYSQLVRKVVRSRESLVQAQVKFIIENHSTDQSSIGPRHYELFLDGDRFRSNSLFTIGPSQCVEIYTPAYGARKVDDEPIQNWSGAPEPKISPDFRKFGLIAWFSESVGSSPYDEFLLPPDAMNFSFDESTIEGKSFVIAKYDDETKDTRIPRSYEVWLSEEHGYQPVRIRRVTTAAEEKVYDFTIDSTLAVVDGNWFPVATEFRYLLDGELTHRETMTVVRINFGRGSHEMFDLEGLGDFKMTPAEEKPITGFSKSSG